MSRALGSLDPRTRVVAGLVLIITAAILQTWPALLLIMTFALTAALASGTRIARLGRAFLLTAWLSAGIIVVLPFVTSGTSAALRLGTVTLNYSATGIALAGKIALRVFTCAVAGTLMRETMTVHDLLSALQWLRVPVLLTELTAMTLRYIDVLAGEAERMAISRQSRCQTRGSWLWDRSLRSSAQTIGALLLRALDRSERINNAMLARGYSLNVKRRSLSLGQRDQLVIAAVVLVLIFIAAGDFALRGV